MTVENRWMELFLFFVNYSSPTAFVITWAQTAENARRLADAELADKAPGHDGPLVVTNIVQMGGAPTGERVLFSQTIGVG